MPVAYTNHIGHSSRDTHSGKSTAISSVGDLAATEKHNNHDYNELDVSRMQSDIDLSRKHLNQHYVMVDGELKAFTGHLDLDANVRKIYEDEFADVIKKYNAQQIAGGHPERQIVSYIDKISNDKQQEVAVEGLIQIGSLEDWENKSDEERLAVVPILEATLKETLKEINKNVDGDIRRFVLAGASLHMNEGSPHIHYVGVPIQESPNVKKGLNKRVKKTAVFTKNSLGTGLQDNVRAKIEPMIQETFGWTFIEKKTGRNEDRDKNTQVNEILKEQIRENKKVLSEIEINVETAKIAKAEVDEKLSESKEKLSFAIQKHQELQTLNEKNLKIIEENEELIADQEQEIVNNDVWLEEQANLMDLYHSHEEYLEGGQKVQEAMDDIQEDLNELPVQAKLFHAREAENWRERAIRRLHRMMDFVKYTISKLQIFEKQYPDEATEQLSVPAQKRAAALDDVIANAVQKADQHSEPKSALPEQIKTYYREKDLFWNEYRQAQELATEELRQAYRNEELKGAFSRYKQAQYLVKNSAGIITLGLSVAALIMTKVDLKREQQRAEKAKELQQELRDLCQEAVNLNVVQRNAYRRNQLTDELEREILEQQAAINDRLKEIQTKQSQPFSSSNR